MTDTHISLKVSEGRLVACNGLALPVHQELGVVPLNGTRLSTWRQQQQQQPQWRRQQSGIAQTADTNYVAIVLLFTMNYSVQ